MSGIFGARKLEYFLSNLFYSSVILPLVTKPSGGLASAPFRCVSGRGWLFTTSHSLEFSPCLVLT